jgi:hypothetical protein
MKFIFNLLFLSISIFCWCQPQKDTIRVFYLGGQSNMQGYGNNSELPAHLNRKFKNVYIFQGNPVGDNEKNGGVGIWDNLKPGHGDGFSSNGKSNQLSEKFGIELSFAQKMQELYPNQKIAIIKYSRIGSAIDSIGNKNFGCWDLDFNGNKHINQYGFFLKTIENAFAVKDINNDDVTDVLLPTAIFWMQGESDADKTEAIAANYYTQLNRLMTAMRAVFGNRTLPVVIGKITDSEQDSDGKVWDYGELVQYAQEKFCKLDSNASVIRNTKNYKYSDKYHYNSVGYVDFGVEFAKEFQKLKIKK